MALARFRSNLSATHVVRGVAQTLRFADATFDGAVAWGVMFHLPQAEEIKVIATNRIVRQRLRPSGPSSEAASVSKEGGTLEGRQAHSLPNGLKARVAAQVDRSAAVVSPGKSVLRAASMDSSQSRA